MKQPSLKAVYAEGDAAAAEARYDNWANDYEAELFAMGYRLPWHFAAVVERFLPAGDGPILDAGCGGGLQMEPLALLGLRNVVGADLSKEMMEIARKKNLYSRFVQITLGETLPFETGEFRAGFCVGTITPGHAPPHSLDELARVTETGGLLFFSLRTDPGQQPEYPAYVDRLVAQGRIRCIHRTPDFATMPIGEPEIRNAIYVCEVLS